MTGRSTDWLTAEFTRLADLSSWSSDLDAAVCFICVIARITRRHKVPVTDVVYIWPPLCWYTEHRQSCNSYGKLANEHILNWQRSWWVKVSWPSPSIELPSWMRYAESLIAAETETLIRLVHRRNVQQLKKSFHLPSQRMERITSTPPETMMKWQANMRR